jgi:hypothetical protein
MLSETLNDRDKHCVLLPKTLIDRNRHCLIISCQVLDVMQKSHHTSGLQHGFYAHLILFKVVQNNTRYMKENMLYWQIMPYICREQYCMFFMI